METLDCYDERLLYHVISELVEEDEFRAKILDPSYWCPNDQKLKQHYSLETLKTQFLEIKQAYLIVMMIRMTKKS